MKKILSMLLVCIMLCTCCVSAFALTDEEKEIDQYIDKSQPAYVQMMEAAAKLGYMNDGDTNPIQTNIYEKDGFYYIDITYTPAYYMAYIRNNPYYTINPNVDKLVLFVNFRIDGADWVSNLGLWGMTSLCMNADQTISFNQTEPYTFTFMAPVELNNDLEYGPYGDYFEVKDGFYYLDLTKHTVDVQVFVNAYFGEEGNLYYLPQSSITTLQMVTSDNLPTDLPTPDFDRVHASTTDKELSFRVAPNSVMDSLKNMGHEVYVKAEYTVHGNTTTVDVPYTGDLFYTIDLSHVKWIDKNKETERNNNYMTVRCAFYDKTTGIVSTWMTQEAEVKDTRDPATIENWQPGQETSVTETQTCNLCKSCPVQPLGMCLWMCVGAGVCFIIAGVVTILIIKDNKKSNTSQTSKNTKPKKEKK